MNSGAGERREVVIEQIGARGDGIARAGAARLFVPLALPGERVRVRVLGRRGDGWVAEPVEWLERAERAAPPCPHFGACGGCQLQHLPVAQYRAWKRDQVVAALTRQGLGDLPVAPLEATHSGARRRARFAFERHGSKMRLGFRERSGHRVIGLGACPVLTPELVTLLSPLGTLLQHLDLARGRGEIEATASATGIDLLMVAAAAPTLADREAIAAFADARDLARIAWRHDAAAPAEPIVQRRPPSVAFEDVLVELPASVFLQASEAAEVAIRRAVGRALGDARPLADLFAGCGTFGLPLAAAGRTVHAVEADAAMLEALRHAAARAGLAVTSEQRDLDIAPLAGVELDRFDAVVADPPRAGARAQAAALAASNVPRLAMVSCNPATFARDARLLVDGGYRCRWVQPIDAFLWSSRIELVGAFVREAPV